MSGATNTTHICVETAVSEGWKHTNERWILQLALPFVVEVCSELRPTFEKILTPPESNGMGRVEKWREIERARLKNMLPPHPFIAKYGNQPFSSF